jgi:hypothetical protein
VAALIEKAGPQLEDLKVRFDRLHYCCGGAPRRTGFSRWAISRAEETAPQSIDLEVLGDAGCELSAVLVFKDVKAAAVIGKLKGAACDVFVADVCNLENAVLSFFASPDLALFNGSSRDIDSCYFKAKALEPGSVGSCATPYL